MDDHTQREVASGLQEGSSEAWLRLYDAYAERVWAYVARMMMPRDADQVADVVQETFLAAARSARRFNPRRGSLWHWLTGIARRHVALHYRKETRSAELARARKWWASLNGDKRAWLAAEADAPARILASRELAELVRAALARLPTDYQVLLTAKYIDGASGNDLAVKMDSSPAAVRSKLARARRAFRRAFSSIT